MINTGDRVMAEALRISYERLVKSGWKFNMYEVGENAAHIINGLKNNIDRKGDE